MTSNATSILHYSSLRQIGAGGMGVVYRAVDTRLDRPVALKFLPEALSVDSEAKRRLLLEAKAAAKLDHPNIGVIHGIEEADGRLFIVMALYEGETLEDRLRRGPLHPRDAVDLCLQAARGLARAHEDGIIHRDVKPANLFLTRDGLLKILDFGLVKLAAGDGLTTPGALVGTPEYMAPEQVRGQPTDHRVDLWGLGVVLYQMLTGVSPFRAEGGLTSIILRVVTVDPQPIAELLPDLPPAFQDVLGRALAKDPEGRYSSAQQLVDDLLAIAADGRPRGSVLAQEPPSPAGPPRGTGAAPPSDGAGIAHQGGASGAKPPSVADLTLARPGTQSSSPLLEPVPKPARFIGREQQLSELCARLERERLVAIRGMPGMGKTALGSRLAHELHPEEQIFWFTFDPVEKNSVDALFWSLAAFLAKRGEPLLWKYLQGEIEAHRPLDRTVRLNLFLSSLQSGTALFCFDDIHVVGGDADVTELFKTLHRLFSTGSQADGVRFLLMGRDLPADLEYLSEPLTGFSREDAQALVQAYQLEVPLDLVQRLCERTQGNPTLLELAVSALGRMGDDRAKMAGFIESMAGRSDIRDYVMNHIYAYLQPAEKSVVDALSVFPAAVEMEVAEEALANEGLEGVARCVEALIQKAIVHEADDGQIYCHDLVREFCYRTLDLKAKRRLHEHAAEYYQRKGNPLRAAHHTFEQGDPDKALALLTDNLHAIINSGGAASLLEQLQRFDVRSLSDTQRLGLDLARGEALTIRGEFRQAAILYEEALDEVLDEEGRGELLARLGTVYDGMGDYERAIDYAALSREAFATVGDRAGIAQAHRVLGWAYYRLGRLDEAKATFQQGMELATALGDRSLAAKFDQGVGMVDLRQDRLEEARARLERSRRTFRELRDRIGEAETIGNLAWTYGRLGQLDRELSLTLKAREIVADVGDVGYLMILDNNLGDLHHRASRFDEAVQCYEQLASLARRVEHSSWLGSALVGLAENHLALGNVQVALENADMARSLLEGLPKGEGPSVELAMCHRVLGEIHLSLGEPQEARDWFARSIPPLQAANEAEELAKAQDGLRAAIAQAGGELVRSGGGPVQGSEEQEHGRVR